MSTLGVVAIACIAFIFGSVVGIILISMYLCNDQFDNDQASYELGVKNGVLKGRSEMRDEMMGLCSHCGMRGPSFDELNLGDRYE